MFYLQLIVCLQMQVYQDSRLQIEDGNLVPNLSIGGAKPPLLHMNL